MSPKKTKTTHASGKNKYLLQLTRKGVFLGICLIFFISAWMFVLGILVGRGTAPVHFDIEVLQKELIALKESIIKQAQEKERAETPSIEETKELDFYEALKSSQKEDALELRPPEKTTPPAPETALEKPGTQKKQLTSMKKKTKRGTSPSRRGDYAVQVASTQEATDAAALVKKLTAKGYRAYSTKVEIPEKGTWYRVRAGGFRTSAEADKAKEKLAKQGYKGMVVKN